MISRAHCGWLSTSIRFASTVDSWRRGVDADAAYVHIVSNETIEGIELGDLDVNHKIQVADMTSTLLSRCGFPPSFASVLLECCGCQ
jgi:phosphoserine aminotransferase